MTLHSHSSAVESSSRRALLLAPAASLEGAAQAFEAGADAVYVGVKGWSRGGAKNELLPEQVRECAELAHGIGKSLHLAVNVIPSPRERQALLRQIAFLADSGLGAVILNDAGFVREVRRALSSLPITVSIGCGALNPEDASFYRDLGATAVVFPGYLEPAEVAAIKARCSIQVEVMLHMIEEFNQLGKCWMPSFVNFAAAEHGAKDGRLSGSVKRGGVGACYRICQEPWMLLKNGQPVDERILTARQISRIAEVSAFLDAGVDVIKIQGRSLAPQMVAAIVARYHSAMTGAEVRADWTAAQIVLPRMWTVQGR